MFCGCFGKREKIRIEIQVKKKYTNIGATTKYHIPKHAESTKYLLYQITILIQLFKMEI